MDFSNPYHEQIDLHVHVLESYFSYSYYLIIYLFIYSFALCVYKFIFIIIVLGK